MLDAGDRCDRPARDFGLTGPCSLRSSKPAIPRHRFRYDGRTPLLPRGEIPGSVRSNGETGCRSKRGFPLLLRQTVASHGCSARGRPGGR